MDELNRMQKGTVDQAKTDIDKFIKDVEGSVQEKKPMLGENITKEDLTVWRNPAATKAAKWTREKCVHY